MRAAREPAMRALARSCIYSEGCAARRIVSDVPLEERVTQKQRRPENLRCVNISTLIRRDRVQLNDLAAFEFLENVTDTDDIAVCIETERSRCSFIGYLGNGITHGCSVRTNFTDNLGKKIRRIIGKCGKAQIALRLPVFGAEVHGERIWARVSELGRGVDELHSFDGFTSDLSEVCRVRDILSERRRRESRFAVLLHRCGDKRITLAVRDEDIKFGILKTRHE